MDRDDIVKLREEVAQLKEEVEELKKKLVARFDALDDKASLPSQHSGRGPEAAGETGVADAAESSGLPWMDTCQIRVYRSSRSQTMSGCGRGKAVGQI